MNKLRSHPIRLIQVGSFYEAYGDDAKIVSDIFGLKIAKRGNCGFPVSAASKYLSMVTESGIVVSLYSENKSNGTITRNLSEIITPAINFYYHSYEELTCLFVSREEIAVANPIQHQYLTRKIDDIADIIELAKQFKVLEIIYFADLAKPEIPGVLVTEHLTDGSLNESIESYLKLFKLKKGNRPLDNDFAVLNDQVIEAIDLKRGLISSITDNGTARKIMKERILRPSVSEEIINRRMRTIELFQDIGDCNEIPEISTRGLISVINERGSYSDLLAIKSAVDYLGMHIQFLKQESIDKDLALDFDMDCVVSVTAAIDMIDDSNDICKIDNCSRDILRIASCYSHEYDLELTVENEPGCGWVIKTESKYIPDDWVRLGNNTRYTTNELIELNEKYFYYKSLYEDKRNKAIKDIMESIRNTSHHFSRAVEVSSLIAFYFSMARSLRNLGFAKPLISNELSVEGLWHPLCKDKVSNSIEKMDCCFLITGPNSSGKSTFMKQMIIAIIFMQAGIFVPAKTFISPLFGFIGCKVYNRDDISRDQSVFVQEMQLLSEIKRSSCRRRSAIFLDEICQNTSYREGCAIAAAFYKSLIRSGNMLVIISHSHELISFLSKIPQVRTIHTRASKNEFGELIFDYKLYQGANYRSYGFEVAEKFLGKNMIDEAKLICEQIATVDLYEPES